MSCTVIYPTKVHKYHTLAGRLYNASLNRIVGYIALV